MNHVETPLEIPSVPSVRASPAGCRFTSSGMVWPIFCQSSLSSAMPRWLAMALRWIGALVEPPIAELTLMAFRNAARVMMSEGLRSSRTISTMRMPVRQAISCRSR